MRRAKLGLLAFLVLCAAAEAQTATESKARLSISIKSDLSMSIGAEKLRLVSDTSIDYTNAREGSKLGVSIQKMAVKVVINGQPGMDTELTGAKIRVRNPAGEWTEITPEKADPAQKAMMADAFDKTLAEMTLDGEGKETARTITGTGGANALLDNGAIENARFFHPRFTADKSWISNRKISVGNGRFAEGELRYEKVDPAQAVAETAKGLVKVKVSGELKNAGFKQGPTAMRNMVYAVSGSQLYDPERKAWVSGSLEIKVSWDILGPKGEKGQASGAMALALSAVN